MQQITKNCLVTISMKIELEDGTLIDQSEQLTYLHGSYGQIFQKIEDELQEKTKGAKFNLLLTPEEAFGEYDQSLVVKETLDELPEDVVLGMELDSEEDNLVWIVEQIEDGYAILNANHELAGVPLRVSGEVLDVEQLSDDGAEDILNMEHHHHH